MNRKPLVYVAGPYRKPEPVINTHKAIRAARDLRDTCGVVPLVPHLTLLEHMVMPELDDDYWLAAMMDVLRGSDAMYRLPGFSTGTDAEECEAERLGIPVFYDRQSLKSWAESWTPAGVAAHV